MTSLVSTGGQQVFESLTPTFAGTLFSRSRCFVLLAEFRARGTVVDIVVVVLVILAAERDEVLCHRTHKTRT